MATYVIVPGGWAGAYQWPGVAALLRARDHTVFTPTLTGLGERVHLAHQAVDLDLHVLDILNVLKYEKLSDVILCVHSYGGMVITGVAESAAGLLKRLVYIDAMVPRDGESAWDVMSRALAGIHAERDPADGCDRRGRLALAWRSRASGWRTLAGSDSATLQNSGNALGPRDPLAASLPRSYIYCTQSPDSWGNKPVIAACAARARAAGWDYHELPTNHVVFATMPKELTAILTSLA